MDVTYDSIRAPTNKLTSSPFSVDARPSSIDDGAVEQKEDPASEMSERSTLETIVGRVIGPQYGGRTVMDAMSCPCCHHCPDESDSALRQPHTFVTSRQSLLNNLSDDEVDDDDIAEEDSKRIDDDDLLPGTLGEGVKYVPTCVLIEGWVHKKGTGKDWFGTRSWKARWARLIAAQVDGYECNVPLLQIMWHPSAPVAMAILLESTVVLAIDLDDRERWNCHRFEIRHATTRENMTIPVTRTFTASKPARDAWVYAISDALLNFEKEKDFLKKSAVYDSLEATGCIKPGTGSGNSSSSNFDEVWTGDRFVTVEVRSPLSPPSSPPPARRDVKNLPVPSRTPNLPKPTKGTSRRKGSDPGKKIDFGVPELQTP